MKITFLGANHEVTGSCTLLEAAGRRFLIDCGMEQGKNVYENQPIPVAPGEIDWVLATHAHIDHTGMLPLLVRNGFRGKIYATNPTVELCGIMLRDSAHPGVRGRVEEPQGPTLRCRAGGAHVYRAGRRGGREAVRGRGLRQAH